MRYQQVDTISFEDIYGSCYAVKGLRELPSYSTLDTYTVQKGDRLDEIISRPTYYGDDTEGETYKLFEHNVEELFESQFNVSKLTKLRIPVR